MARTFILFVVATVVVGMVGILGTGCPPANDDLQKVIIKALSSDGCRGCDSCNPDEGEGESPEGEMPSEGEASVEGEGELLEGELVEGENQPEGEGEILDEGEGESQIEGEGEVPNEGEQVEGEMVEGEGESIEGEMILEGEGEGGVGAAIIGPAGGRLSTPDAVSLEIPAGELPEDVIVEILRPEDSTIRSYLDESVPFAGSVNISTRPPSADYSKPIDVSALDMKITVPITPAQPQGSLLDVYLQGEITGEWIKLDSRAEVNSDVISASFSTNQVGTFIVRAPDEHSTLTLDYDTQKSVAKGPDTSFVPAIGYGLHRVPFHAGSNQGTGHIPIILIHGVGSHEETQQEGAAEDPTKRYARWDNFINSSGIDLNTYQLWLYLHDSYEPVGYDYGSAGELVPNNVHTFITELANARANKGFPGSEQQFIMLAHSRGGLVARTFVEKSGMADQVMAAITLATPHHGSPLAVPEWGYHTLSKYSSLSSPGTLPLEQIGVWMSVAWWLPGYADLAWDNFDGTVPHNCGIPERWFTLITIVNHVYTPLHQLTTNDAGKPMDAGISDITTHLPDSYRPGRRAGTTLWDLNHGSEANQYINKFILYAGHITNPLAKSWYEHAGLQVLVPMMERCESNDASVSHFAANDGMVPLQSALYLTASTDEPIYATETPWWNLGRMTPKEPLELDSSEIADRFQIANPGHGRIWLDFDHLDMVDGKGSLFSTIKSDLENTVEACPTAILKDPTVNGLTVMVDASGSYDNGTDLWPETSLEYRVDWDASDGLNWSEWNDLDYTYPSGGVYIVGLQARDQDGMMSSVVTGEVTVTGGEGEGETETILLPGNVPLEMIWIPGGTFLMGRYPGEQDSGEWEDPQHPVTVPGFWMGKYEVTKAQWTAVMGTTPWSGQGFVLDDPDSPVVYVSWNDARAFITALNTHTGQTFRLPSEAEWEYACRAGTTTRIYWGDDPSYTEGYAYCWWYYNTYAIGEEYAHVVGLKLPNGFGLYDMSGNVWEFCEDDWHSNYTGAPADGSAWVSSPRGPDRVVRGGGWYGTYYLSGLRSASRNRPSPTSAGSTAGFRLAR